MKRANPRKIALIAAVTGIAALVTGCGSANSNPGGVPGAVVNNGLTGIAGCVPISQAVIGFNAAQSYVNWNTVLAGTIPTIDTIAPGRVVGPVTLSAGGGAAGPYRAPNNRLTITPDGSISMNITPMINPSVPATGGYGYDNASTGPVSGVINISQQKLSLVMAAYGVNYNYGTPGAYPYVGTPGYNPTYPNGMVNQPCVNGLGISLSHDGYDLYGGKVYLYVGTTNNMQYVGQTVTPMGSGRGFYLNF